jgi:Flp pilus assembly protein TadG
MREERTDQPDDERTDGGVAIVENLVAIVLLGLIASSMLAGIYTVIRVSSFSDDQAKVSSVLGSASDRVANFAYSACPQTVDAGGNPINTYQGIARGAVDGVGWDPSVVTVTKMEYWQPGNGWVTSNGLAGDCNSQSGLTQASAMQKVTISVTAESGGYTLENDVIKTPVIADYNPANDPANT